jgi:hypothetical protein
MHALDVLVSAGVTVVTVSAVTGGQHFSVLAHWAQVTFDGAIILWRTVLTLRANLTGLLAVCVNLGSFGRCGRTDSASVALCVASSSLELPDRAIVARK